uniref:LysR substrate-binding domain-containing protein n=1 Tax=Chitinimonas sp. TaxID=1934313 RepID=UPI0035AF0EE6
VGVQLEQQNLDAAVVFGKEGSEFANATPLFAERLTPVCAPAMAQRLRQPADLANETLIHLSADHADWRAWLAAAGVSHPDLAAGPSFEVIDMAVNLASQGRGVAIADPVMIADDLLKGSLCAPFAAVTVAFGHRYWFSCPHGRQAEPALLAMRDWLEAEIAATLAALATIGLGEQAP